jgi:hypothetical protein
VPIKALQKQNWFFMNLALIHPFTTLRAKLGCSLFRHSKKGSETIVVVGASSPDNRLACFEYHASPATPSVVTTSSVTEDTRCEKSNLAPKPSNIQIHLGKIVLTASTVPTASFCKAETQKGSFHVQEK